MLAGVCWPCWSSGWCVRRAGAGVSAVSVTARLPWERAEGKVQPWHRDRLAVVYLLSELRREFYQFKGGF